MMTFFTPNMWSLFGLTYSQFYAASKTLAPNKNDMSIKSFLILTKHTNPSFKPPISALESLKAFSLQCFNKLPQNIYTLDFRQSKTNC